MRKRIFIFLVTILIPAFSYAENFGSPFSLGLGYPYVSLKYRSLEAKAAYEEGVEVYGGRLYFDINSRKRPRNRWQRNRRRLFFYTGAEYDKIFFDTEEIKGEGYVFLPFVGGEYFTSRKFSLSFDFGPGYIKLKDSQTTDVTADGWEWIINMGIWIYF